MTRHSLDTEVLQSMKKNLSKKKKSLKKFSVLQFPDLQYWDKYKTYLTKLS